MANKCNNFHYLKQERLEYVGIYLYGQDGLGSWACTIKNIWFFLIEHSL